MKTILDYFKPLKKEQKCPVCNELFWMNSTEFEGHVNDCIEGGSVQACPICGIAAKDIDVHVQECIDKNTVSDQTLVPTKPSLPSEPKQNKKECPWYKWIPKTTFTVDAFQYGQIPNCTAYFLSHFHSDHYMGLSKSFQGLVYCSEITARLVHQELCVPFEKIMVLPLNIRIPIQQSFVTLFDANHCPGSVIFLFEVGNETTLHTGDFRACETHWQNPLFSKLNYLFLDTTYCNPQYVFPPQQHILQIVTDITERVIKGDPLRSIFRDATTRNVFANLYKPARRHTLFIVGSYKIGKEKVFMTVARVARSKVFADYSKLRVLKAIQDPDMTRVLTDDPDIALVHVVSMTKLQAGYLTSFAKENQHYDQIVCFKPTGWTFQNKLTKREFQIGDIQAKFVNNKIVIVPIPYSEHSSFLELREMIQNLEVENVIPTVNVGRHKEMKAYFEEWKNRKCP